MSTTVCGGAQRYVSPLLVKMGTCKVSTTPYTASSRRTYLPNQELRDFVEYSPTVFLWRVGDLQAYWEG
jgi:hypothetical protein